MLDEVWTVHKDEWFEDYYDGYSIRILEEICDSFESACNYVRNRLTEVADYERSSYNNIHAENPSYCEGMTFEEVFADDGYTFDPDNLPDNDSFAEKYTYFNDGCGRGAGYLIRRCEIKHYD